MTYGRALVPENTPGLSLRYVRISAFSTDEEMDRSSAALILRVVRSGLEHQGVWNSLIPGPASDPPSLIVPIDNSTWGRIWANRIGDVLLDAELLLDILKRVSGDPTSLLMEATTCQCKARTQRFLSLNILLNFMYQISCKPPPSRKSIQPDMGPLPRSIRRSTISNTVRCGALVCDTHFVDLCHSRERSVYPSSFAERVKLDLPFFRQLFSSECWVRV